MTPEPCFSNELIDQVQENPNSNVNVEPKSFRKILEQLFLYLRNLNEHQIAVPRFLESGNLLAMNMNLSHFHPERNYDNWAFWMELIRKERKLIWTRFSSKDRTEPDFLELFFEHANCDSTRYILDMFPDEEMPMTLFVQIVQKHGNKVDPSIVPSSFWKNRDFVVTWLRHSFRLDLSDIPELNNDREICSLLYQSRTFNDRHLAEAVSWMSKSLLADKEFVLECLGKSPTIWEYCEHSLQIDFDVLLSTALGRIRDHSFLGFVSDARESLAGFASLIQSKLEAHQEFTTWLACFWRSRQLLHCPLSLLDGGEETVRAFKSLVAENLDAPARVYVCQPTVACGAWEGTPAPR